jgi:hypothetical protein
MKPMLSDLTRFPGGNLVSKGMSDLNSNVLSEEALLVLVARSRLTHLGFQIPVPANAKIPYEHALYEAIELRVSGGAHSAYNALIRRIVSFANSYTIATRS